MTESPTEPDEWWEQTHRDIAGRPVSVEVYLRSFAPPLGARQRQESVVDTLRAMAEGGILDGVGVTVWGEAVCPDGCCAETPAGRDILASIAELQQWADEEPVPVETPFEEKRVTSSVTDEAFRKVVPPRVTVGVYCRGDVALVLPCEVDGETFCVSDLITAFERTDPVRQRAESSA